MLRLPFRLTALSLLVAGAPVAAQPAMPELPHRGAASAASIDSLITRMTIEEKLGQLTLYVGRWSEVGPRVPEGGEAEIREGKVGTFYGIYGADYTREMQRVAVEESRLGIPLLFAHDVLHGFRTTFPMPLAEAASFDPEVARRSARIAAVEASAHGLHWTFAPMVDVARDPRWGRIVEGSGEDPYLGGVMAAARVRGFQGTDLRADDTVLATAKHFVAYGAAEGGRDYNTTEVGARTLHEVYLPPFRAAVEAGVGSVMAAFNEIDGLPLHAHAPLIEGLLRRTWGFDGVLVSDYTGIQELMAHGVAATPAEAGRLALEAGVDVDIVSGIYLSLADEVRAGRVDEAVLDAAVRRVLEAKARLGLFEDPYRYSDAAREAARTLTDEHLDAARDAARRSIVLLKNDGGLLPFSKDVRRLAVVGPLAADARATLGSWTAAPRPELAVSVLDGIRAAVSEQTEVVYVPGLSSALSDDDAGIAEAVRAAAEADAVVLVVGEPPSLSAEASSRSDLGLPGRQLDLARAVLAAGTPTAVVLMNGRPLALPWLAEHAQAILESWYLGIRMGPAVADVIFGDYNPGGKLPATFPRSVGQVPLYYNHLPTGRPPDPNNRFTSKYLDVPWTPLYPFGHGLSFTTFAYRGLRLSAERIGPEDSIQVEITVENTGDRAGDEVVQLYIRDEVARRSRPVMELRRFRRLHLAAGQSETVAFTLGPADLATFDDRFERIVEPGFFTVFVGTSSAETQTARFEVVRE